MLIPRGHSLSDRRIVLAALAVAAALGAMACTRSQQPAAARGGLSIGAPLTHTPSPPARLASSSPRPRPTATPPPVTANAITRGNPALPEVALVFNVGAGSPPAMQILDILSSRHVAATFFVMGWLARHHPDVVRQVAAAGFPIGSHGDQVPDLTKVSDAAVAADLESANRLIKQITGHDTQPLWSPSGGYQNASVRQVAAGQGYDTLLWTVDSGDWRTTATAASMEAAVIPRLENGAIIVLHLDSPQSRAATVPALPVILDALRSRGLTPVSVTTLLRHLPSSAAP